ncbi:transmembrane protein 202 isoform X3 [Prionailurus viverrinus]|uniref:transmembrane protein 202 isoform X3 n=1 Tax=Prionailurus viverrinus TaxID=61388 RepID=UPI001FF1F85B|nr:transmembrane protein 202 isoform X3 [Prionailurus viverrinus]
MWEVLRQIPWQLQSKLAAKMESREQMALTFYNPKVPKIKGNRHYQRPTLPVNKYPNASMPPQRRQQHVNQTHIYIRTFCGSLCGFGFLMVICMSPLNWVRFLVTKNGFELYAGLWITCNYELCWSHTPKPPYYLQYSRTFFLISIFSILVALGWLISSCLPRRGSTTTNFDLKVSILSFISGIMSLLNYITFRFPPLDQNVTASPTEKSRLGVGPVTKELPAEDEGLRSDMEAPTEEEKTAPEAEP